MIVTGESSSFPTRDRLSALPINPKGAYLTSEEHQPALTSNFPLVQFRYFESADILSVYPQKITSGLIVDTWDVHPGLLVDYADEERPVALNISSASSLLPVHFYEACGDVDGKPPLQLGQVYDPYSKVLTLRFCNASATKDVMTSDSNIRVMEDRAGNWVGLQIRNVVPPVV